MKPQHKEKILALHQQGKSRQEIVEILGCARATVIYHVVDGKKQRALNMQRANRKIAHPFIRKLNNFKFRGDRPPKRVNLKTGWHKLVYNKIKTYHKYKIDESKYINAQHTFTVEDVIEKFGVNPKCYLTGAQIDIHKPRTYSFDHIIPRSRGGLNTIENLGICTNEANRAKSDLTPQEFYELCLQVVKTYTPGSSKQDASQF